MNTCSVLIEQFRKSMNNDKFSVKYFWNSDEHGYYYKDKTIGIYDNKICDMTVDEEVLLSDKSLKQNCMC